MEIEHNFADGDVKLVLRYVVTDRVHEWERLGWIVHHCFVRNGETLIEWVRHDELAPEPGNEIS